MVGVHHLEAEIEDTRLRADGREIDALLTRDQRTLRYDLFVDASGFRSVLMGKALGSPFKSYATSLLCDSAIVGAIPSSGAMSPYTFAETMNAGWCWNVPVEDSNHRGYVYSSAFLTEAQAQRSFVRAALPQREALELLRARPDLLRALVDAPKSWCIHGHEFVSVRPDGTLAHMPHGVLRASEFAALGVTG